jgi:competence protein ComEA
VGRRRRLSSSSSTSLLESPTASRSWFRGVALGGGGTSGPTGPVHLNSATLEQLDALPGVGPVTAQKILAYRQQHGGFGSVDELDAVPGIGPARLADLRSLVAP